MSSDTITTITEPLPRTLSQDEMCTLYLQSLSEMEYKAYCIAKSHLGTSFNLVKINGFIRWKTSQGYS